MTEKQAKIEFESHLLIALFKATTEQSSLLINEYNQKLKSDFNIWKRIGDKLLEELEKRNYVQEHYLHSLSDIYHNINSGLRDEFYNGFEKSLPQNIGK